MGNAETLPLSQAKQDIGYVAIVLRRTNKVRIIYDTPQIKSVLYEIVRYVLSQSPTRTGGGDRPPPVIDYLLCFEKCRYELQMS